jgi:hypothetical protein
MAIKKYLLQSESLAAEHMGSYLNFYHNLSDVYCISLSKPIVGFERDGGWLYTALFLSRLSELYTVICLCENKMFHVFTGVCIDELHSVLKVFNYFRRETENCGPAHSVTKSHVVWNKTVKFKRKTGIVATM